MFIVIGLRPFVTANQVIIMRSCYIGISFLYCVCQQCYQTIKLLPFLKWSRQSLN